MIPDYYMIMVRSFHNHSNIYMILFQYLVESKNVLDTQV